MLIFSWPNPKRRFLGFGWLLASLPAFGGRALRGDEVPALLPHPGRVRGLRRAEPAGLGVLGWGFGRILGGLPWDSFFKAGFCGHLFFATSF